MTFDEPFVLTEDARAGGSARLFRAPAETVVAHTLAEVEPALVRLRGALGRGLYAAGWMSYEAGLAFEERLSRLASKRSTAPLLWFGFFKECAELSSAEVARALPDPAGAWLSAPRPRLSRADYERAFVRVQDYIVGGDVYQINLSYRADLTLLGEPLAAYARLRDAGGGGWSGVVFDGENWLLSTSPELFFRISSRAIEARPMKGTAKRGADAASDRAAAAHLQADAKERAENVMIVDLLRNDVSRVAETGSVHVPALFTVETYPTLHTLTSTVRARLRAECDAVDTLRALFPCGSVTGAPKIRAMEIIDELETDTRGAYTGSIGWMAPDGDAAFNVAIRTLAVTPSGVEMGLGSAVVADSSADGEWAECAQKGRFVTSAAPRFELIETMRYEPSCGIVRRDLHLARLRASAQAFGFVFDEAAVIDVLNRRVVDKATCVVRLTLAAGGEAEVVLRDVPAPLAVMRVALAPLPVRSGDFRLQHKTTLREFYDEARQTSGADEVVFFDEDGFLTEGSITNLFVETNGVLLTPPLTRGLLPGVLRAELIAGGRAREGDVQAADLERGFYLGNSVRGLTPARLV